MADEARSPATTPGMFDGLGADIARELGGNPLAGLAAVASDRSVWTVAGLVGGVIFLGAVPLILAWYGKGLKALHAAFAAASGGTTDLETTLIGFPRYPITTRGTLDGRTAQLCTFQRALRPHADVDASERARAARSFTEVLVGLETPAGNAVRLARRGGFRRFVPGPDLPAQAKTWRPATGLPPTLAGWDAEETAAGAAGRLLDAAVAERLRALGEAFPALVVTIQGGRLHVVIPGALRGAAAAASLLGVGTLAAALEHAPGDVSA